MRSNKLGILALAFIAMLASQAQASWPNLPIACLPERAAPWVNGKSEAQQEPCHCPPSEMCPTTSEVFRDNSKALMPMSFVARCCPQIPDEPKCPDGKPMPADGKCTETTNCPSKFYPSLVESEIIKNNVYSGTYKPSNGDKAHKFRIMWADFLSGRGEYDVMDEGDPWASDINLNPWQTARLKDHYYWSIRLAHAMYWIHGPTYGGYNSAYPDGYLPLTNGINNGQLNLEQLSNTLGPNNLTWYGISVALIDNLPDNLATDAILNQWNGRNFLEIAGYGYTDKTWDGKDSLQTVINSYDQRISDSLGALQSERPEVIKQCRNVKGEYLEIEYKQFGNQLCPYLQCRYIYDTTTESCLAGDVKITLADGSVKPVKDLVVGDAVKSASGEHTITATNQYRSKERILYGINGSDALITGDHPIRTTKGWTVISDKALALYKGKEGFATTKLAVGDTLITLDGEIPVTAITKVRSSQPIATYNIKIDGNNSFYANGIEVKGFDSMQMNYK